MILTTYKVMTPHGAFEAAWDEDEEKPVKYAGSPDAIAFFKAVLGLKSLSGPGGALIAFDSLEPAELFGFCNRPEYGITVLPNADDLAEENDMEMVIDAVSEAEEFALLGEGTQLLSRLAEDSDSFFADVKRLQEIVQALGESADIDAPSKPASTIPEDVRGVEGSRAKEAFETAVAATSEPSQKFFMGMHAMIMKGLKLEGLNSVEEAFRTLTDPLAYPWKEDLTFAGAIERVKKIDEALAAQVHVMTPAEPRKPPVTEEDYNRAAGAVGDQIGSLKKGRVLGMLQINDALFVVPDSLLSKVRDRKIKQLEAAQKEYFRLATEAEKAAAKAEDEAEQAAYSKFDWSQVKMPTAVQLGAKLISTSGAKSVRLLEGSPGWTNGHLLDIETFPNLIKKVTDEVFGGELDAISQPMWERIVNGAKQNRIKVEPISAYDSNYTQVNAGNAFKGKSTFEKVPVNTFVLSDADRTMSVQIDKRYFGYFAKTYKGAEFFASDERAAVLVKHHGKIVGVVMPVRGNDGALKRAMKAATQEFGAGETADNGAIKEKISGQDRITVGGVDYEWNSVTGGYWTVRGNPKMLTKAELGSQVGAGETAKEVEKAAAEAELMAQASDNNEAAIEQRETEKAAEDTDMQDAKTFLQSVIDGTADMMSLELADRLTAIHDKYSADPEMIRLFNDAAKSYSSYMVAKAKEALA